MTTDDEVPIEPPVDDTLFTVEPAKQTYWDKRTTFTASSIRQLFDTPNVVVQHDGKKFRIEQMDCFSNGGEPFYWIIQTGNEAQLARAEEAR